MGFFRDDEAEKPPVEPTLPMPEAPPAPPRPQPPPYTPFAPFAYFFPPPPRPDAGGVPGPETAGEAPKGSGPATDHPAKALWHKLPVRLKLLLFIPAVAVAAVALIVAAMLVHYTMVFPDPLALRHKERAPVIRILARDGSVLAERGKPHEYMPIDLLPKHVTDAVVATEDRRFWDHWGLDPWGLLRAVFANLRAGRFAQGGSTLTQQLAKNLFLSPERTLGRKVEELVLALWLELRLTKHDILELYLNQVYFGGGAYGIEAAAHRYFDKSASELNLAEAALIAGLLKAPSKYSPASSPGAARARGRTVLKKMLEAGLIGEDDERRALKQRIQFANQNGPKEPTGAEYAVEFVLERMPPLVASGHSEIVVETTIDAPLQRRAQDIVRSRLKEQGEELGAGQAALAVLDPEGGIRVLIGGRSYGESQFNRAVKARRQPGSAFKPIVYLAALEAGYKPNSIAYDLPLSVGGWAPRNDNGKYVGAVPLHQALSQSINTVAVRLLLDVGARKVAAVARRLGITSELREGPAMALGSSELSLLELTAAYSAFGNGGMRVEPHVIRRVRLSSGRVLYARDAVAPQQVISQAHVAGMNDMLNAVLVSGTGKRAALADHPAGGKTGTTSDFRDAWFVGYTAHLTGGVWVGNDTAKTMNKVMGGSLPALIWHDVMAVAHKGKAPLNLPGMHGAETARTARATGSGGEPAPAQRELLPWAKPRAPESPVAKATLPRSKPGEPSPVMVAPSKAATPARDRTLGEVHPKERIGDDFVARALAASGAAQQPTMAAKGPMGFDVDDVEERLRGRKIVVQPPPLPGMMTLGRSLQQPPP